MYSNSDSTTPSLTKPQAPSLRGWVRFFLMRILSCLEAGRLTIVTPAGERIDHRGTLPGFEGVLNLHNWRALRRLVAGGDIGFAEAYIDGDWSSPDLTALISLVADNSTRIDRTVGALPPIRLFNRLCHLLKGNSHTGSRRNIAFHYDLGNDFYRLWLDRSMTYSSAHFVAPDQSLEAAQQVKLQRVVERLDLRGDDEVLEIGCGWGALAARLAQEGARVTGLTLSTQQLAHAQTLVAAEGSGERVGLRLQDYRDVDGHFDRIVSIEMLEAVGEQYWPIYFQTLRHRLKAGGTAVLQVITIDEERFAAYRRGADFIQRYIFPGGLLPTKTIIAEQAARVGLALASVESFGTSYALTLAEWRRRFLAAWPAVEELGFRPSFRRLWEYYLSYCEAGFRTKIIDVSLYAMKG
jgi:cyclopropane-fatty-acyl-phospholipid synthase